MLRAAVKAKTQVGMEAEGIMKKVGTWDQSGGEEGERRGGGREAWEEGNEEEGKVRIGGGVGAGRGWIEEMGSMSDRR